jgi:hypothetical protein
MIVEAISSKSVKTKFGDKPAYSIKCNGQWYQFGFKRPTFREGDDIDFDFEETTYGNKIKEGTVTVSTEGGGASVKASAPAASPSKAAYGPPSKPFPIPALHGDRAIVRQNSLTNAVNVFINSTKQDVRQDTTQDILSAQIIALARKFEAYSTGSLDEEIVRKAMKGD